TLAVSTEKERAFRTRLRNLPDIAQSQSLDLVLSVADEHESRSQRIERLSGTQRRRQLRELPFFLEHPDERRPAAAQVAANGEAVGGRPLPFPGREMAGEGVAGVGGGGPVAGGGGGCGGGWRIGKKRLQARQGRLREERSPRAPPVQGFL